MNTKVTTAAHTQDCSGVQRRRTREDLAEDVRFDRERRGDELGADGGYHRRRKPSLDELDAESAYDAIDDGPPPGWGRP